MLAGEADRSSGSNSFFFEPDTFCSGGWVATNETPCAIDLGYLVLPYLCQRVKLSGDNDL